jgi:multidrug resistance efflux pump
MKKNSEKRIPIGMKRRLQMLASGLGPALAWVAAAAIASTIVVQHGKSYTLRGLSAEQHAVVAPAVSGRLLSVPINFLDEVKQGDVLAVLDDGAIRDEIEIINAEAALLQARISAEKNRLAVEAALLERGEALEVRRLAVDISRAQLDGLDRRVTVETKRVELQRLRAEEARLVKMQSAGVSSIMDLEVVQFQVKESEEFLDEAGKVLKESQGQFKAAQERLEAYQISGEAPEEIDSDLAIAVLEREGDVLIKRLRQAEKTLASLVIHSPLDGHVAVKYSFEGSDITAGTPIVEILGNEPGVVIAWVPEDFQQRPAVGDLVMVLGNGTNGQGVAGRVESVPPTVLPLPEKLRRQPNRPEYGLPVRIQLENESFPAGHSVQVVFQR